MNILTVLLAMIVAHIVHCTAVMCETVLESRSSVACRRCCRAARWTSIAGLLMITVAYCGELYIRS